jgi:hypothetical protein
VNFDGFGLKIRFGRGGGSMRARDLLEFSTLLDRYALFGKSVHLSGVQVPSKPDPRDNNGKIGQAGYWHDLWSEEIQAEWIEKALRIAYSKPFIETIAWQDVVDRDVSVLQFGGLLRKDYTPKPAFDAFMNLKNELLGPDRDHSHKKSPES